MKSYLEIQVPLRYDATWFQELRTVCQHIPVKWQTGYYHITMAFLDETPEKMDLRPILDRHLTTLAAPTVTFDKLDAFTAHSGMHIIHLTATDVSEDFLSAIERIRTDLKTAGCQIESDFRLHVTLGRVKDANVDVSTIQKLIQTVHLPMSCFTLTDVDYREFRGKVLYNVTLQG
ncbi:MAG: 2'-5' RNA ligase family protein [Prevotella sp.]|nr:2'-5' RNA ligase family protein [Prevotella sp.]